MSKKELKCKLNEIISQIREKDNERLIHIVSQIHDKNITTLIDNYIKLNEYYNLVLSTKDKKLTKKKLKEVKKNLTKYLKSIS
tara:strand:+ start:220 stop:468 length:249 start_codon:yes stop_codon:yes gene_type:complete